MCKFTQNQYIYLVVLVFILLFNIRPCFAEFTIEDEKKLGKEFYDKLYENQLLIKNKVLSDYITKIGNLVLAQTTKAPFDFNFFIIDSSAINAFATPGGYIYINKGLIMAAENEAELAGVIAHEIGHANARHIARIIEKSKKLNIAALAAMLAGVFLGGGGETSAAIAAFSLAGSSSMTLRYMREHEEEADRMGIEYLVRAGYYPTAMIDFLKIMKQSEYLSKTMPSYLLTHPGTDDRIIYMDSLILTQYSQRGAKNIIGNLSRIQAYTPLDTSELSRRTKQLEDSLKSDPNNFDLLYNLAVTEDKLGLTGSALEHFKKALGLSPRDDDILKNIGLIYLKTGEINLAQEHLIKAININPGNNEITLALGKAYFAAGKYKKALDCYLSLKDAVLDDTDINYFIAMAYGKLNISGESHFYFGLHFKNIKRKESALFHFKEALNYFPRDSKQSSAINQEIKELGGGGNKKSKEQPKH
jgi:beta-barrel assembly-enhancing protease